VFLYAGHAQMGPSIELDVTPWAARKADAWLSQTTQVEMLPRIRERVERLRRVQEQGGTYTERFVLWERNTLDDLPPLPAQG
jgi:hypothetical protein